MGVRLTLRRRLQLWSLAFAVLAAGVLLGLSTGRRPARAEPIDPPGTVLTSMEAVLHRQGLAVALDSLERRAARDSSMLRDGHQMAHALGREAVAAHGGDASIIRECRPAFASGCYHGVVEASLHAAGRIDMAALERLCVGVDSQGGPGPGYECIHGLGHGVLGAVGYDIGAALHDCDALSTARRAGSCHSGVFMEAITSAMSPSMPRGMPPHPAGHAHGGMPTVAMDSTDPYSPCRAFRDPYATSCWLFQGFVILRRNGFDAARALRVCDHAPDGRAPRCYESVGHQLTGLFQQGDRWVLDQCARGRPDLAAHCAAGAVLALDAMDWSGGRAARLCAAAPAEWMETCYRSAAGSLIDLATAAQRTRFCASVGPALVRGCREAAELEEAEAPPH